ERGGKGDADQDARSGRRETLHRPQDTGVRIDPERPRPQGAPMRAASRPQPVRNTRGGGVTRQTGLGSLLVGLLLLAAVTGCGTSIEAAESVDLADTRTALEAQPFIRLRTTMELEADGTRMPLSEYTVL